LKTLIILASHFDNRLKANYLKLGIRHFFVTQIYCFALARIPWEAALAI